MSITIRTIKSLSQGETIWDQSVKGFGARRQTDCVSYVLKYRHLGKQRFVTLGRHGVLTPDEARRKARKLLGKLSDGVDPIGPKTDTLGAAIADYLKHPNGDRSSTLRNRQRYLLQYWRPYHRVPLAALRRRDVALGLSEIETNHSPSVALKARAALSACINWAIRQGYEIPANPVAGTNRPISKSRDRVLTDAEIAAIWRQCPDDDFGRIVKLLLLTGQRRTEVGGMAWSEIDLERKLWTLPATRTKNHREHIVPLTDAAIALLPERWRDHVFGRSATGFNGWSVAKPRIKRVKDFKLHDLRRTAATGMAELGIAPHLIEAILNHYSGHRAGVAGVYNRARYLEEMRSALEKWAAQVTELSG